MDKRQEEIVGVLAEVFGESKPSLSIGENRGRKNTCYYYCVDRMEHILPLLDHIRSQYSTDDEFGLAGLRLDYYGTGCRTDSSRKTVLVRLTDEGERFVLKFCTIEGVRFHRSYGKKLVATLVTGKYPLLELFINRAGMIFMNAKMGLEPLRFHWWINKCLMNNEQIRLVVTKLLLVLGQEHAILKDLARTIEKDHYFLPPIQFSRIVQCHTPSELMKQSFFGNPSQLLKVNYNKIDLNAGYYITSIANQFDEASRVRLINYPINEFLSFIRSQDLYDGPSAGRFLIHHYLKDLPGFDAWEIKDEVNDYIAMCRNLGEALHIYPSFISFVRKHDELAAKIRETRFESDGDLELAPLNSEYKELAEYLSIASEGAIEWIRNSRRLNQEGVNQHNCVYCYRNEIRNDLCAIFHLERSGESYTIRIAKNHYGLFYIAEMKAKYNKPHRKDDFDYMQGILNQVIRFLEEDKLLDSERISERDEREIEGWTV